VNSISVSTLGAKEIASFSADSVWGSLIAARSGIPGSFGDSATSWKGANVASLALEATAQQASDSAGAAYRAAALSAIRWGMIPEGYDSTTAEYYPLDGTSPKDSVHITAWPGGSIVFRGYYHHSNNATVADSLRTTP